MKKFFLLAAVCGAMLTSCSDDDSNNSGSSSAPLSVKVNGTQKNFSDVTVELEGQRVYVTAMSSDHAEILSFESDLGYTGEDMIYYVEYEKNNTIFFESETGTTSNVEVNTEHLLKGTFNSALESYDDNGNVNQTLTLTNGKFNLPY